MKTKLSLAIIAILLLISSTRVFADDNNWYDNKYNFSQIKVIAVAPSIVENSTDVDYKDAQQIVDKELLTVYGQNIKNVKFVSYQSVIQSIEQNATGVDIQSLKQTDTNQYKEYIKSQLPKYCQAIMEVSIASMGYTHSQLNCEQLLANGDNTVWDKTVSHTDSSTSVTHNSDGSITTNTTSVTTSASASVNLPSTDQVIAAVIGTDYTNMGLRMRLLAVGNNIGQVIWTYNDIRSRGNPMLWKTTTPEDMLERIANDSSDNLNNVVTSAK